MDFNLDFNRMDAELVDLYDIYELYKIYKHYRLKHGHRFRNRITKRKRKIKKKFVGSTNSTKSTFEERQKLGSLSSLMPGLIADVSKFEEYCRMSPQLFQNLVEVLGSDIKKCDTNFKNAIDPEVKVMLTLRYLAYGECISSLHRQFRIATSTIRIAIHEVCKSILKKLGPAELPAQTVESLEESAAQFFKCWQYPHCVGAIASRVIRVTCPRITSFYGRKTTKAILLQGVTNADGIFTFIDACDYGDEGKEFDFRESALGNSIIIKEIPFPEKKPIRNSKPLPYVFLADSFYPLMENVMRPYPPRKLDDVKTIYNRCHSETRQVAEQAFNMMLSRWRVLTTSLQMFPEKAKQIAHTCCILHNFVRQREELEDHNVCVVEYIDRFATQPRRLFGRYHVSDIITRDNFAKLLLTQSLETSATKQSVLDGNEIEEVIQWDPVEDNVNETKQDIPDNTMDVELKPFLSDEMDRVKVEQNLHSEETIDQSTDLKPEISVEIKQSMSDEET